MNIFIGYESSHPDMFEVCKESILRFNPTHKIYPLIKSELQEQGIYTRKEESASTEFALLDFLFLTCLTILAGHYSAMETFGDVTHKK